MNEDNYVDRTVGGFKRRLYRMVKPERYGDYNEFWAVVLACREFTKNLTYWDRVRSWRDPKYKRYLNDMHKAVKRIMKANEEKEYGQSCLDHAEMCRNAGWHIYDDERGLLYDPYYGSMY